MIFYLHRFLPNKFCCRIFCSNALFFAHTFQVMFVWFTLTYMCNTHTWPWICLGSGLHKTQIIVCSPYVRTENLTGKLNIWDIPFSLASLSTPYPGTQSLLPSHALTCFQLSQWYLMPDIFVLNVLLPKSIVFWRTLILEDVLPHLLCATILSPLSDARMEGEYLRPVKFFTAFWLNLLT